MIEAAPAGLLGRRHYVAARAAGRRFAEERLALVTAAAGVALLPLAVPTGPANLAPNDVFMAIALGACLLWAGTAGRRLRFPYVIPVAMLLAGGALGALAGSVPNAGIIALVQDFWLLLWCWVLVNVCYSSANLRVLLTTWVYSGIVWAILAFVGLGTGSRLLTGQIERQGTRVQITLADPSYAANYLFITMMIIWAAQRPRRRAFRLATYALLLAAIATTGSNSGLVAVVVGTVVATTLGTYRRFGMAPAVAVLASILLGGYLVASNVSLAKIQDRAHESRWAFVRQGIGRSTQSAGQRETLVTESIRLYKGGNPLGEGPVSTKPRLERNMAPLVKEAHDDYFAALIERGALGFVGVLLLVSTLALRGLSVTKAKLGAEFASTVRRPNALVGAVAGTLVAGTVYELLHVRHVWALFALLAATHLWGRE
jgi:O-antigen ligase/polysaccharide polymerase Wzy-like membrane protein